MASNFEPDKYGSIVHFSSLSFLGEGYKRLPFDLAVNARAVQIHTEQGKAAGVTVMTPDKQSRFISASNVVVSASAFESGSCCLIQELKEGRSGTI